MVDHKILKNNSPKARFIWIFIVQYGGALYIKFLWLVIFYILIYYSTLNIEYNDTKIKKKTTTTHYFIYIDFIVCGFDYSLIIVYDLKYLAHLPEI